MTEGTARRGPYASTRRRREQITQAVLDVVEEAGHAAVTISEVADRSGTSEATVLYHFPSKDHLLVAALQLADQREVDAANADRPDAELSLTMEDFRDLVSSTQVDDPLRRMLNALRPLAEDPAHPAAAYLRERTTRQLDYFTRLIARRQHDGIAHPALDPRRTAAQVIGVWDGLTALWLLDPSIDLGEAVLDAFRRLTGENVMETRALVRADQFGL